MEQPASNPTFCTNNCGFYGSSQFEGMCSKCYREHVNRSYNNPSRTNSFSSYYSSSGTSQSRLEENLPNQNSEDKNVETTSPFSDVTPPDVISSNTNELSASNQSDICANNSTDVPASPPNNEKKKRNRCSWETCNKKLGLTGFDCRCGGQFCSLHRYANEHNCTFDYKEHGQNEIRKNMPVVQGERVRKI